MSLPVNLYGETYKKYTKPLRNKKVLQEVPLFFDSITNGIDWATARCEILQGNDINLTVTLGFSNGKDETYKLYNLLDDTISNVFKLGEVVYSIPYLSFFGKVNLMSSIATNVLELLKKFTPQTGQFVYKKPVKMSEDFKKLLDSKRSPLATKRKNYRIQNITLGAPAINYSQIDFLLFFWNKKKGEPYHLDVYIEPTPLNALPNVKKELGVTLFDVCGQRESDFVENMKVLYPFCFSFYDVAMFINQALYEISRMYAENPEPKNLNIKEV